MSNPITIHCKYCRSNEVTMDGVCTWNTSKQVWDLVDTYDKTAYCNNCSNETRLVERHLNSGNPLDPRYDLYEDEAP